MKIFRTLGMALLLSLTATAPGICMAEEEEEEFIYNDNVETRTEELVKQSPALAEWRGFLETQFEHAKKDDDLSAENVAGLRELVDGALAALEKLYRARLVYGLTCIRETYFFQIPEDKDCQTVQDNWVRLLEECALRDLRALQSGNFWCGGNSLLSTPASGLDVVYTRKMRAFASLPQRGTWQEGHAVDIVTQGLEEMVNAFRARLVELYDCDPDSDCQELTADFITGFPYESFISGDCNEIRKREKELFMEAESLWEPYKQAVLELVCPCPAYYGTGAPQTTGRLECLLLDSEDMYLSGIVYGAHNCIPELEEDTTNSVSPQIPGKALGQIFTEYMDLTKDANGEWCVVYRNDCLPEPILLPIAPGKEAAALLATYPEGWEFIPIRGYLDIEVSGKPYERTEDSPDKPEDGYSTRTVFRVLTFGRKEAGNAE